MKAKFGRRNYLFSGYNNIHVEKKVKANFDICQENIFFDAVKKFHISRLLLHTYRKENDSRF